MSEELFGDGETIGSGDTAAHIIWQAAQDYHINPQALISLIQRESGLITDSFPSSSNYRSATGYGCPDTAACDSKYYGFKNQVRNAAELFRYVLDHGSRYYPVGDNYIAYNPNQACGGSKVSIENKATSALYQYNPYQPNAAALNADYGSGDSCSSYSNRNFYHFFHNWFDETQDIPGKTDPAPSEKQTVNVNPDDVPNQTYIIGTYMFTRDKNLPTYPGYVTTKSIMFASRTIEGDNLDDMKIYYKTARGLWVDGTTNLPIEQPEFFEIYSVNIGSGPMETMTAQTKQIVEKLKAMQEANKETQPSPKLTVINSYPWQNDCPEHQLQYVTSMDNHKIGGYVCECTSYAAWKAYEVFGIAISNWGSARSWNLTAAQQGYIVNHTPETNTIGQIDTGTFGHVFWVESLNSDGSIDISEYNSYSQGDFSPRTIPASQATQYNYIYLE